MNVEDATSFLRANGYVVIPKDRHVILQHSYCISDKELQISKQYAEALRDNTTEFMIRSIGKRARQEGLLLHTQRRVDFPDPSTVFTVKACFVKPKEESDA